MSEEIEPTQEATPAVLAITDEQVAAHLGIPVEEVANAKNVAELYKRANNYNREAKALFDKANAQQAVQQPTTPTTEEDAPEFDAATQKALNKLLEQKLGPILYAEQNRRVAEMQEAIDTFHDSHSSEPEYAWDKVQGAINDLGLDAVMRNPAATAPQVKRALDTAYKYLKAQTVDVEKLAEKKAAELLEKVESDGEVIGIKPKRSSSKKGEPSLDDPNLSTAQRGALVRAELKKLGLR